jgi:hypothetical protein
MLKKLSLLSFVTAFSLALAAGGANAAQQCRDAKGKFIKCPTTTSAPAKHCRDTKTKKFVKCGTAGSEVVPGKAPTK